MDLNLGEGVVPFLSSRHQNLCSQAKSSWGIMEVTMNMVLKEGNSISLPTLSYSIPSSVIMPSYSMMDSVISWGSTNFTSSYLYFIQTIFSTLVVATFPCSQATNCFPSLMISIWQTPYEDIEEGNILCNLHSRTILPVSEILVRGLGKISLSLSTQSSKSCDRESNLSKSKEKACEEMATSKQKYIHGALSVMIALDDIL